MNKEDYDIKKINHAIALSMGWVLRKHSQYDFDCWYSPVDQTKHIISKERWNPFVYYDSLGLLIDNLRLAGSLVLDRHGASFRGSTSDRSLTVNDNNIFDVIPQLYLLYINDNIENYKLVKEDPWEEVGF